MSRTYQPEPQTPTVSTDARPDVALVAAGGLRERIAAVVEEQGLTLDRFGSVERLLGGGSDPALVVLMTDEPLAQAVGRDLEPLRRGMPSAPVVIVCAEIQPGELRAALAAGVAGVVLESRLAATLGSCLEAARTGQVCVPREDAKQVEPASLSPREKQILGLVVMGYMNGQIAEQLFVAESTVKSHLSSAFSKLGVRSRSEAVDLILDPARGLGMGILALGGEPVEETPEQAGQ